MEDLKKSGHAVQDDLDLEGLTVHDNDIAHADPSFKDQLMAVKHHRRAVLAALACSTTPILISYDLTLVGSIIANTQFIRQFGVYDHISLAWSLPANHQLMWSIVQYMTAMVAAIVSGSLNDTLGRRACFLLTVGLAIVGTFVELFSTNWKVWIVAKLFMGATMGSMQANTQKFDYEITPTAIRGLTLSLFQFWIIVGQLIASCILEGTSHLSDSWSWRGAVVSQFGPALFCIAMFFAFVPESPYDLISQGKVADARASLARLRPRDIDIKEEVRQMQATLEHKRQLRDEPTPHFLACLPVIMQILMGYPLCGNYLAYFLILSGVNNAFLITMISTIVSLLAALAAFILIDRVGRRPQMLTGCYGMLACLLMVSILGFEGIGQAWNYRALTAFCIIWALFYFSSVGGVKWAIVGEISSSRTTSLAALSSSLCNIAWSIAIPYLVNKEDANLGAKSGLVFLGMGCVRTGICFFALPETKGRSFGTLDALFEARTPARKFLDARRGG